MGNKYINKDTILIYFYSDYKESFINLYASIKKLGLLEPKNIYSILIYKSDEKILDDSIVKKFNLCKKVDCESDLNGYFEGIQSVDFKDFKYFLFMNSSCLGPILPIYFKKENWDKILKGQLIKADLISPIIEFPPYGDKYVENLKDNYNLYNLKNFKTIPFAHSYFLFMNKNAIKTILENNGFPNYNVEKKYAISFYERYITAILISKNLKIKSFLKKFEHIIFSKDQIPKFINKYFKDKSFEIFKDPEIPNLGYFGSDLNPYEVVFFKNLRFPHSQRGEEFANISSNNKKFLDSIISLKEIRNKFNINDEVKINKKKSISIIIKPKSFIIKSKKLFQSLFFK
tara:strand:+ start:180 stop:1211 length:1032 start_codon:yes stop_codon:yes gene_type:complete